MLLSACIGKNWKHILEKNQYERILDYDHQSIAKTMMENTYGFEHGRCYKIRNRADTSTVIEFMLGSSNKMVCGHDVTNGEDSHQVFEAVEEDSGEFRIACRYQSAEMQHFWDYLPHRKQLIHKKKSTAESSLQLWKSECVPGMDTAFFVISVQNGLCLKSNGKNKQVSVVERNENDPAQHWRLETQPL
ncbi:hypothetical protein Ocin01_02095 [Orchesella cincta]|uniref:Ricin B lectin domain-containing protein n=1 Tax=Orchesella cincta TaxID=48709 RepID=A0A1D2NHM6_ORCCI|nr:hypothetical protein Ocin01_02095 [Orchesella cincta]